MTQKSGWLHAKSAAEKSKDSEEMIISRVAPAETNNIIDKNFFVLKKVGASYLPQL